MTYNRITILIDSLRGGGAERVCTTLASGLAESGWNIDLVVVDLNDAAYLDDLSGKVNLVDLKTRQIRSFYRLYSYFKDNKVDRVLVFNHQLAVIVILLKKIFRLNVKVIARNINTLSKVTKLDYQNKIFKRWLVNKFYKKADFFVNQCKGMEEDLLSLYPELVGKTAVIYNPVAAPVEKFADDYGVDFNKGEFLLCVGRLSSQKAFHLAIECFSKIHEEYPGLSLKIIGQGEQENELKELAVGFGIEEKVHFEGFNKNVIPYYLKAKAVLLTSEFEGFPNVVVESLTLGTPVVAFDIQSGPNEIIQNGVNGFLVENRNVDSFSEKLRHVLQCDFDRAEISKSVSFTRNEKVISDWSDLLESDRLFC